MAMETISRDRLYTDLMYRFQYVSKFIDFGEEDKQMIHDAATYLAPLVPTVVDAVYTKLFSFDITKKIFADRMEGFDGKVVSDLNVLNQASEQIKFRKDMLSKYLVKLVTADYNEAFVKYLDWVGLIHTKNSNKKTSIQVEYIHINALLGYVETILIGAISDSSLDATTKKKNLVGFQQIAMDPERSFLPILRLRWK